MTQPKITKDELLPDLPDYDPEPADGVRVGESPVLGITLKRILWGHSDKISRVTWSPNGKSLVSPSYNGDIRLWDIESGNLNYEFSGTKSCFSAIWSLNDKVLAAGYREDVQLWDSETHKLLNTLHHSTRRVDSLAWSESSKRLASGAFDGRIRFWDLETGQLTRTIQGHRNIIWQIAYAPNEKMLASASQDGDICIWHTETSELVYRFAAKTGRVSTPVHSIAWAKNGRLIASCGADSVIKLWDCNTGKLIRILEGHTGLVKYISFSCDGKLLASKSMDHTVKLWLCDTWKSLIQLSEFTSSKYPPGIAFHPYLPILATLGERDSVIRIWELDVDILINKVPTDPVRYTTAKLVLVGNSGVGKTGLGWRLAHGEFKEQSSTHGQQFWVIDKLGKTRDDGTECEAVLWDVAGQHVYRPIHSIFLDNVDASLVLFDPTNRQEPLKGAQFWLEQLKGKGQLPPSVLVGARMDRGGASVSQDYLRQFCQQYGIRGGYIPTSAKTGEGLAQLLDVLKTQIPWDAMTTTVTTRTFKRIKEYVLHLKERPDRRGVLVSPGELRGQLKTAWDEGERPFDFGSPEGASTQGDGVAGGDDEREEWQFTDAKMMTAVGHLETHGYVTVLHSSGGETHILLAPELLATLAASIVLLADKHPRELGAVSETELLQGRHTFEELAGLDEAEQQVLLDAAVLRFLEHSVCFRESFDDGAEHPDTLLIFPGLIKQKRPLDDDFPAADDVSYVVRGRVENLYTMLVVLLGYTPSFIRINQWQRQAQYAMGKGAICGFRMIEDREGEIELVLYYSEQMPSKGRADFQALFERFLYQREVEVTRYPPVACSNGHRMERNTVISLIRENQTSAFCPKCGQKIDLPELDKSNIGLDASDWLEREEAVARLRSLYEQHLGQVKSYRREWATPRCYLSRAPGQDGCAENLIDDLKDAGVYIIAHAADVKPDDYVVILDTLDYQQAFHDPVPEFAADVALIKSRMGNGKCRLISIKLEGDPMPEHDLATCSPGDFCDPAHYPVSLFNLVLNLYAIPLTHAHFSSLREALHRRWERMPREKSPVEDDVVVSEVAEQAAVSPEVVEVCEPEHTFIDFDLHISPEGHVTARSCEGEAFADISTEIPVMLGLSRNLIASGQINADLFEQVGQLMYEWLFPGDIHTHLHQTEATARNKEAKLRIRLRVEAEEIASLPLEFMYRKAGGYFLAVNPDTVLSRYLNLPLPQRRVRRREGPLHLLTIISSPQEDDLTPLDIGGWETLIRDALAPLNDSQIMLTVVKQGTLKGISAALKKQKPDIVQFVGHGQYKGGKGYVALVDEQGHANWLDAERFANIFLGHQDHLGLISLATCESGKSDNPQGFVGIAPKLVQRGVPAVIAMQYNISIPTAKVFFEDFYTSIAAKKPVDWAVQSARNAISLQFGLDNRAFATPVLYMRAEDGQVF